MKSIKGKIIASSVTLACIGSLIAFGISSFAWFSYSPSVIADGLEIETAVSENVSIDFDTFEVYCKEDEQSSAYISKNLDLGTYNLLLNSDESNGNDYTKRFYRFKIDYPHRDEDSKTLSMAFCLKDGSKYKDDGKVAPYISNVVQFKFFDNYSSTIPTVNDGKTNVEEVYNSCVSVFDNISNTSTFVVSNVKNGNLVVTFDLGSLQNGQESTDFIIEADYSSTLLDAFVNSYAEGEKEGYEYIISNHDKVGTFNKDIKEISFDLIKNE